MDELEQGVEPGIPAGDAGGTTDDVSGSGEPGSDAGAGRVDRGAIYAKIREEFLKNEGGKYEQQIAEHRTRAETATQQLAALANLIRQKPEVMQMLMDQRSGRGGGEPDLRERPYEYIKAMEDRHRAELEAIRGHISQSQHGSVVAWTQQQFENTLAEEMKAAGIDPSEHAFYQRAVRGTLLSPEYASRPHSEIAQATKEIFQQFHRYLGERDKRMRGGYVRAKSSLSAPPSGPSGAARAPAQGPPELKNMHDRTTRLRTVEALLDQIQGEGG